MSHDKEPEGVGPIDRNDRLAAVGRAVLSGDDVRSLDVARIAELEAEVQTLKTELAHWKTIALAGGSARIDGAAKPGSLGLSAHERVPPTHVNADGTEGMRRGVSGPEPPSPRDIDEGT